MVITKISSDLDFFLPFCQHAPSLANTRCEIYADLDRLTSSTSVRLFNILAFHGVFFGSPFAQSDRFWWFDQFEDWVHFTVDEKKEATKNSHDEEAYYVKKNCYGHPQKDCSTKLLKGYWNQYELWSNMFNQPTKPTTEEVYNWLTASDTGKTWFHNIGSLTALLICGDLVEASIVPLPSPREFGKLIFKVGKGAKDGMAMFSLVKNNTNKEEICKAFISLDLMLQHKLMEEEKEAMGYNIIMLEHTLCKIKRLMSRGVSMHLILLDIN